VAQAREFLVRLASPFVESGIKKIRREVRAEALALLRHYPYSYRKSDEKRCVGDMSGAWIPVGERLPDTNERVLIFCPLLEPEEIIGATFLMASMRNFGAWSCDDGLLIVETKPTHWMPLPAKPEVTP
jgi:hypothetical protein